MSDIRLIVSATDKATPTLKKINQQVDRFERKSGKARKGAGRLGGAFKLMGAAAAAAAVLGILKLGSGVVKTAAKFESLRASLKTVTGSLDGARVAMHQIEQFTKTTPFQLEEVANSFIILQRMGIDTTTESLKAFGNVAAANGKSFEQLSEAVADAMTGEFERLKEFGIKVKRENDKFITSMGETEIGVANSAKGVVEILKQLGEEGGAYASGLEDQLATLGGKFSNLQDNISSFAKGIGEGGLNTALKDALDGVNGLFEGTSGLANMIGAGIGAAITTSLGFLERWWGFMREVGNFVVEWGKQIVRVWSSAFTFLKDIVTSVVDNIETRFGVSFENIPKQVNGMINKVVNFFRYLLTQAADIINEMPKLFTWTMKNIKEIIKQLPTNFKDIFLSISDMVSDFATRIVNKFVNIGEAIMEAIKAPFSKDASFAGAMEKLATDAFAGFKEAWFVSADELGDWKPSDMMLTDEEVEAIFNQNGIEKIWNWIYSKFPQMAEAAVSVKEALKGMITNDDISFIELYNIYIEAGIEEQEALAAALEAAAMAKDAQTKSNKEAQKVEQKGLTLLQKTIKAYDKLIKVVTKTTDQDKINRDLLPMVNKAYAEGTLNLEQYSEALEKINSNYSPIEVSAHRTIDTIKKGFAGMAGSITDTFYDMFSGVTSVFDGLRSIAASVFQMIAKAVIQTMIVKPILAMMGIPMFAQGGLAAGNAPAIVGENGPELIVPSSNTRVFSNSQSQGMLNTGRSDEGPLTVNFNLNAVSTRDGIEFLIENKNTITSVIQEAYQTRGRNGPLG